MILNTNMYEKGEVALVYRAGYHPCSVALFIY